MTTKDKLIRRTMQRLKENPVMMSLEDKLLYISYTGNGQLVNQNSKAFWNEIKKIMQTYLSESTFEIEIFSLEMDDYKCTLALKVYDRFIEGEESYIFHIYMKYIY